MYHRSFFTNYFHVPEIANIHQFNPNRIRNGKYTFYEIVSRMLFTRIHQLIWQTQHTRQLTFDVCTAECCEVAYMHRRLVNKSFKHLRITEVISLFKVNRQVSITNYQKGEKKKSASLPKSDDRRCTCARCSWNTLIILISSQVLFFKLSCVHICFWLKILPRTVHFDIHLSI